MTRWIVPHSQIAVASTPRAGGEPLCSRSQVVATVGIASHDGAEVASWFSPQAARIDELECAVRRLQGVEIVDVPVDEHGVPVVVAPSTLHAIESVVDGRLRARPSRLLPQPREPVGGPACHVGTGGKVGFRADRTPQPDCEVAQHVVPGQGIGHDVVQGRPESLEQGVRDRGRRAASGQPSP